MIQKKKLCQGFLTEFLQYRTKETIMPLSVRIDNVMRDILSEFGFCGYTSLYKSLVRFESFKFLGIFASLGTVLEGMFGLTSYSVMILFVLILVELFVGIAAGVRRTKKFRARMLQRFGLKVFIYFLLLLVLNTFQLQYVGRPEYYMYASLHSFVVFYIIGVYMVSVLENTSFLLGGNKELDGLLRVFKVKLKKEASVMEDMGGGLDKKDGNGKQD